MDPNATLATIRALTSNDALMEAGKSTDVNLRAAFIALSDAAVSLDVWLSRGGFLPNDWQRN